MYLSIVILPLLGSIVSGFFGRKVGVTGAQLVTSLGVISTTIFAIIAFFEVGFNNSPVYIGLFRWIDSGWLNVIWGFQFDSLTVSMLIPVLIISSVVHIYSVSYMSNDPHIQRFFSYLSLFTFMMIILVSADNYLLMFVGWEGVGVCSYLLVSFWFTRIAANQSSMSAFLTNRVGDCLLVIGMFAIIWSLGALDYAAIFSLAPYINENIVTIIGICILIGAMAKSSQVGLHIWLPMAMEGPTPVSALIHAATMVTAGVYLLMRSSPLIEYSSTLLLLCLWLGAITTVFSSLIGLFQQDIKKVIAYSTMSQLGMMVIAVGLSSYNIALFHLINHAFYKGLLFLGAGAVIHAVADNQDFRKYGGLISFLPLTYSVMLIASLSLVAFPFMTGFYSKDFILESAYGQYCFSSIVVYFVAIIGAIFTTLYSIKVLYLTFLTSPNGSLSYYKHAHEGDLFLSLPLFILAIFSIFFGFIAKDIFIGLGSNFFTDNSLFIHPIHEIMIDTEFAVPTLFKILPLIFTVSVSIIALIFSEFLPELIINFKLSRLGYNIFGFFNQRFLVELFYNKYIVNLVFNLGKQTVNILDKGSIELLGPYGLEKSLMKFSKSINNLNTSTPTDYSLYILGGAIFYIIIAYSYNLDLNFLILLGISLISISSNIKFENPTSSNNLKASVIGSIFSNNKEHSINNSKNFINISNNRFFSSTPNNKVNSNNGNNSNNDNDSENTPSTESDENGLNRDEKRAVRASMATYEATSPKPHFDNPGYPDFSRVARASKHNTEYTELKDRFIDEHASSMDTSDHDERTNDFVVDQMKNNNPEVPEEKIREYVEKKQSGAYEAEGSHAGYTKSEAKWREKVDQRAFEHGEDLTVHSWVSQNPNDSGISNMSAQTPSVAFPPTPTNESANVSANGSINDSINESSNGSPNIANTISDNLTENAENIAENTENITENIENLGESRDIIENEGNIAESSKHSRSDEDEDNNGTKRRKFNSDDNNNSDGPFGGFGPGSSSSNGGPSNKGDPSDSNLSSKIIIFILSSLETLTSVCENFFMF